MEIVITNKEKRRSYKNNSDERIGETRINILGSKMWIIEYVGTHDVTVQFENGYITNVQYSNFKNGSVKNPYDKSLFGLGYLGEGIHKTREEGKATKQYATWQGMMSRCYNAKFHKTNPSYIGCTVVPEWHNFQTFAKWYDKNIYDIEDEVMQLDKDILNKGNKIYSPDNCVFVSHMINSMFTKCDSNRGDLPIGVRLRGSSYDARCSRYDEGNRERHSLGTFNTSNEAFNAYKDFKEQTIKNIAERYKDRIPAKLYDALIKYQVEITD